MTDETMYRTVEAAEILKVSPKTITRMIDNGDIKAEKMNPLSRSRYRIPKSEIDRILELRKQALQKPGAL